MGTVSDEGKQREFVTGRATVEEQLKELLSKQTGNNKRKNLGTSGKKKEQ